jgi:hypothetical protein
MSTARLCGRATDVARNSSDMGGPDST